MQEPSSSASAEGVAAYVGIDWADQKHNLTLRSAAEPTKVVHRRIAHELNALMEWVGELHQRFGGKGKILISLEQRQVVQSLLQAQPTCCQGSQDGRKSFPADSSRPPQDVEHLVLRSPPHLRFRFSRQCFLRILKGGRKALIRRVPLFLC
jgi:hypothetical protein